MRTLTILVVSLLFSLSAQAVEIGQPAPHLENSQHVSVINFSEYHGKVLYLDFWASWCEPCRKSFPWLNEMKEKFSDKGFEVIGINLDTEKNLADQFLAQTPAQFVIGYDPSGDTAASYEVKGMPSSFLIDRKGVIVYKHIGFKHADTKALEAVIQHALEN
jgi:cytochrome c biogenesis protein CcmG/thiol:disulfide interchange protein DsbE